MDRRDGHVKCIRGGHSRDRCPIQQPLGKVAARIGHGEPSHAPQEPKSS